MDSNQRTYGLQFWLLCTSSFLFFMSFNMIIPELPDYLTSLGGEDYKGLFISLFTLAAGLSRPFSGKIADKVGRVPTMIFGALVCVIIGILYPILTTVTGFLILRFFHGFSTGFKPTGTTAYIADLVPIHVRGEALGYLGFFATTGVAVGVSAGSPIANAYGHNTLFIVSSILSLGSVAVLIGMKETLQHREKFGLKHLVIKPNEIFERKVLPAFITMILSYFPFGIMLTIIPDFSKHIGYDNKGMFFFYVTLSSLVTRVIAGKASDKYGRIIVLKVCYLLLSLSILYLGFVDSKLDYVLAALFMGIPFGMNYPTIFAWTIDLSDEKFRGKAMATVYIGLEISIGLGAVLSAFIYANNNDNFPQTFWAGAVSSLMALAYLFWYEYKKKAT